MKTNNILVKLYVPTIEESYEIWIPVNETINTIITLLENSIKDLSKGYFCPTSTLSLYDKESGKKYSKNLTIAETNIRNCSELILI